MTNRYPQAFTHRPVKRRKNNTTNTTPDAANKGYKLLIQLSACIFLIAAAVLLKFTLPNKISVLSDKVDRFLYGNVDYRSALSIIGKTVSGERSAAEALPEVWSYAFGIQENTDKNSVIEVSAVEDIQTDITQRSDEPEITVTRLSETEQDEIRDDNNEKTENENEPKANDAVSEFSEKQKEFSDIAIPANVTYEMPPINLDYGLPAIGTVSSSFGYRMHPVEGRVIFHYGTDIAASEGSDIYAFADGTVYAVGESIGYGNYIIIQHADGIKTQYSHCSSVKAKQGDEVKKGDVIALMGSTGNATGSCLHFEITINEKYVNPEFYLTWS